MTGKKYQAFNPYTDSCSFIYDKKEDALEGLGESGREDGRYLVFEYDMAVLFPESDVPGTPGIRVIR